MKTSMKSYVPSRAPCPIGRASRVLGDRWALLVLREAFLGIEHFEQFMERLPISRAALASRLRLLLEAGLLEREQPGARRSAYRLTAAGRALDPTLTAMRDWAEAWLPPSGTKGTLNGT